MSNNDPIKLNPVDESNIDNYNHLYIGGSLKELDINIYVSARRYKHTDIDKLFDSITECESYLYKLQADISRYNEVKYFLTEDEINILYKDIIKYNFILDEYAEDKNYFTHIIEVVEYEYIVWKDNKRYLFNNQDTFINFCQNNIQFDLYFKED